jgi:hypothetical protein
MPLEVLLLLTVPVVDPDKEDRNWRRPLNCLHLITAPLVCVLTFRSGECKSTCLCISEAQVNSLSAAHLGVIP